MSDEQGSVPPKNESPLGRRNRGGEGQLMAGQPQSQRRRWVHVPHEAGRHSFFFPVFFFCFFFGKDCSPLVKWKGHWKRCFVARLQSFHLSGDSLADLLTDTPEAARLVDMPAGVVAEGRAYLGFWRGL